ncbi:UDP-N-acetyl-D-mannosaminuronic acid transferase [Halomicronema hongdechloris C2206]|uniref:UDP-N-acetyl-D-mannosaminuronic acid transferase n=1 Tax=Halomicronema hongdechloris C2206 TaxID=1641165 RepID=A0A1Z3HMC6_9CYAN|nr:WecB/TagA/CpsF family glycosyltransferase [Halomicronema hongdechloris]ASC71450.1 UDP-N-acetyl-D-mannosaminuronic acid transferase [Halomicronema hongdechloris C2206]
MRALPARDILGVRVDGTSYGDACDRIWAWTESGTPAYVVAANVHVIMTAYWNRAFRRVLRRAALVTPDGMPLVLGLRWLGLTGQGRVYGPDLMLAWCQRAARAGLPIYLYGGSEATLAQLRVNLSDWFPDLKIAGSHAPPFRSLTPAEDIVDRQRIQASGAKVVLVGLGCPKQEHWMARQVSHLPLVMIGVGAAFSFHSGTVAQAPRWMMGCSLEWLYRLGREPRRLWRRYLINNPAFMLLFGLQLLRQRLGLASSQP